MDKSNRLVRRVNGDWIVNQNAYSPYRDEVSAFTSSLTWGIMLALGEPITEMGRMIYRQP